jgi:hypothetical protein
MKYAIAGLTVATALALSANAAQHPCASDAREKAAKILALHMEDADMRGSIDDNVTVKPRVKALKGKGRFDVLETIGYVYKARYRIRMIYAPMSDKSCLLMGQEIFEIADPY